MTNKEREQIEQQARLEALGLGGLLVLLLGYKKTDKVVRWDPERAKFYVDDQAVSTITIREQLNRIETGLGSKAGGYIDKLWRNEWTLAEWKENMRQLVGSSHVLTSSLAAGSVKKAAEMKILQDAVDGEWKHLTGFATAIRRNAAGSLRNIRGRAKSYLKAAYLTYTKVDREVRMRLPFYTQAKRIRRAAESCEGCLSYAGRWMDKAKMPPIGTLNCGRHCRCYIVYR